MLRFRCKKCGQKISVSEAHAGKKGKCPGCKSIVIIPKIEDTASATGQSDSGGLKTGSRNSGYDLSLLDVAPKDEIAEQPVGQRDLSDSAFADGQELEERPEADQTEPVGERRLPWLIDIFLYPISKPGLIVLAIIIIAPLLIDIAAGLLGPFDFFISIPGFVFVKIPIGLYLLWYLGECIRDSAAGGLRAPQTIAITPSVGEMFSQVLKILSCFLIFVGPVGFYFLRTNRTDAVYWSLLGYMVAFFPMGLLAVIMFDSISGLNPILIIGSVVSTFFQYCGLVLVLVLFVLIVNAVNKFQPNTWGTWILGFVIFGGQLYLMLIVAHLLGRFYWRYQEKLNWEV